jgi:hypothetical protein
MRTLEEFKNIHSGEDIYVIASGYSGEFIRPEFFSNKITIGLNQVYKRFKTSYLVRKENKHMDVVLKETGGTEGPRTIHFITEGSCGDANQDNLRAIERLYPDNDSIVVFKHNANQTTSCPSALPEDKDGRPQILVSYSTITTAMHLAAYMGAKTIILVGHDCGTLDGESNFKGYYTKDTFDITWKQYGVEAYNNWLRGIEAQTIKVKGLLKEKYGTEVYSLNPFINFNLEGHKFK